MAIPTVAEVTTYLGTSTSASAGEISAAYQAEKAAQASRCRVPADADAWPSDLAEALCRRVQHNLALRKLPLGIQSTMSETGPTAMRVGGLDAEVKRLEGPYRKAPLG